MHNHTKTIRIGLVQMDVARQRKDNLDALTQAIKTYTADLWLMPELATTGYLFSSVADLRAVAEEIPAGPTTQHLLAISREENCAILCGVAEKDSAGRLFNSAVLVDRGSFVSYYRKVHLTDLEKRFFTPASPQSVLQVRGVKLGIAICFDIWFPEVTRTYLYEKVDLLCVLGNFGARTTLGIAKTRALENMTPLVLCNRVGYERVPRMQAQFLGKSFVCDANGNVLQEAPANESCVLVQRIRLCLTKQNVMCLDLYTEIQCHDI